MKANFLFATLYDAIMIPSEKTLSSFRLSIISKAKGNVLEIGAGTGVNFQYYKRARRITAIEPDPYMQIRAQAKASKFEIPLKLYDAEAENLPFPDKSFDTIVGTLVLCTVKEPKKALSEMARVLRPRGQYFFIEHIRHNGWHGVIEDYVTPVWRLLVGGCHLNRSSNKDIGRIFEIKEIHYDNIFPTLSLVAGVAMKR